MRLSELIEVLEGKIERWGDLEVLGAWAGLTSSLEPRHIYRRRDDASGAMRMMPAVLIDLDANRYKRSLAQDPQEGEEWAQSL